MKETKKIRDVTWSGKILKSLSSWSFGFPGIFFSSQVTLPLEISTNINKEIEGLQWSMPGSCQDGFMGM